MFDNPNEYFDFIEQLFDDTLLSDKYRRILGNSIFYYGSGYESTPVMEFGSTCPLYVYVDDSPKGGSSDSLFKELEDEGFICTQKQSRVRIRNYANTLKRDNMYHIPTSCINIEIDDVILSAWSDGKKSFYILTAHGRAVDVYKALYHDDKHYVCPKCICNYKFSSNVDNYDFLEGIESNVDFILGYNLSPIYTIVREIDMYNSASKVPLYRRSYRYA